MPRDQTDSHSAAAAVLGFYYQTFYALLTLLAQNTDDAAVMIEQLDDVQLTVNGETLLYQLKHSIINQPPPITIRSRALWRTIKVWADSLASLALSETTFHLVTVAEISRSSPLRVLTLPGADRAELVAELVQEAQRVMDARTAAEEAGEPLPFNDRADGCQAFLGLTEIDRLNLMRRTLIYEKSPSIEEIEDEIGHHLHLLPREQRSPVSKRLVGWWEREVVYSMCGMRHRIISRVELQQQIAEIIGDIERCRLIADFETIRPPDDYEPDGMLTRQIRLVEGKATDLTRAIREEWKAREQRSKWINSNPGMAVTINEYDQILHEHWFDRHSQMVEECAETEGTDKCASGLKILRWTHEEAPREIRPVVPEWSAPYYVRGSYQVLAINLTVGWHPDYVELLGEKK